MAKRAERGKADRFLREGEIPYPFYVRFAEGSVAATKELRDGLLVDYDANGNVIGAEILCGKVQLGLMQPEATSATHQTEAFNG